MHKKLAILILLFLINQKTSAQTDSLKIVRNALTLEIGYNNTLFKDLGFSPLNYSSNSLVYKLGYRRDLKKGNELSINSGFSRSMLKSDYSNYFTTDRYLINFKVGYLKNLTQEENNIQFKAGVQYRTYFNLVFYDDLDAFTFYGLHGLDLIGKMYYQLNPKHRLITTIEIPFFGLLVRPPYSGINKFLLENDNIIIATTGKWTSLNDFFALNWSTEYNYLISDKLCLSASYCFAFHSTNYLHKVIIVDNQILMGVHYNF